MALHHDTYIDGLILRDGNPLMWQYDGGYVALNASAAPTSWNYYISDHLGSTRMVVTSTNTIKEAINYYPYGSEMRMTNPAQMTNTSNKERFRFSGKELDFQNGLNMYDFGARMFDVAGVPVWTSMDPLAEDNRHVTPYSYCNGDPVNRFDPDGKEVRDGLGAYCADNHRLKSLVQNLVKQNDPNSIVIVAHGIYDKETSICASSINIKTYNPNNKEWEDNYIETGKQLANFLSVNSKVWNNYKNGSIEAKDLHIVFYACGSSSIVKEISKDEAFKDITFIAPNKSLYVGKDGYSTSIANVYKNSNGKITYIDKGEWHTIKNGQEPLINGNYNEDEKPGTKDFDYEWSPLF